MDVIGPMGTQHGLAAQVFNPMRVYSGNQADEGWGGRNGPCRKTVAIGAEWPANWEE
jgi:hypothetical protein